MRSKFLYILILLFACLSFGCTREIHGVVVLKEIEPSHSYVKSYRKKVGNSYRRRTRNVYVPTKYKVTVLQDEGGMTTFYTNEEEYPFFHVGKRYDTPKK